MQERSKLQSNFSLPSSFFKDKKHVAIAVLAVLAVVSVSLMGRAITSYATYVDAISGRLSEAEESLGTCSESLNDASAFAQDCQGNLSSAQSSLGRCEANLDVAESSLSSARADVEKCRGDLSSLKSKSDALQKNYDTFAENSAKDICCTRGIASINWDAVDNFIVCSGPRNATC